jgi:hypothetical protein
MPENDLPGVELPIKAVFFGVAGVPIAGDWAGSIATEPEVSLAMDINISSTTGRTNSLDDGFELLGSCCAERSCSAGSMKAWGMSAVAGPSWALALLARIEQQKQIKNADLWLRVCLIPVCMSPSWLV